MFRNLMKTRLVRSGISAILLFAVAWCAVAEPLAVGLVYTTKQAVRLEQEKKDDLTLYRDAVMANGGVVVAITQTSDKAVLAAACSGLDAVLLPGGIDVVPRFYGETPHAKLERTDAELDETEFFLLTYAVEHGLPVLGICRGEQVMNVHFGGSLYQDIPSQVKAATPVCHRFDPSGHEPREHVVEFADGTLLRELLGVSSLTVNTYHHQAVDRLAPGFRVSARAADGVVEAVERVDGPFMVGVQFHPEKMRGADARFNTLFSRFLDEARKVRDRRAPRAPSRP